MNFLIAETPAADFVEELKVAAIYIECEGKILYLRKAASEKMKGLLGVPGGKVAAGEDIRKAAKRELEEETGIKIDEKALEFLKPLYVQAPGVSFGFYIYLLRLKVRPDVVLSQEHDSFVWAAPDEIFELDIMGGKGGIEAFLHVEKHLKALKRPKAAVSAYLILRKGDLICLGRRQNTGYQDGYYGFISGHVEEGESASQAMIREAEEEAGIKIDPENLKCVHIMHQYTPEKMNIDIFFECNRYSGELVNNEPKKCCGWEFFDLDHLPEKTMDYLFQALKEYRKGNPYSERGF